MRSIYLLNSEQLSGNNVVNPNDVDGIIHKYRFNTPVDCGICSEKIVKGDKYVVLFISYAPIFHFDCYLIANKHRDCFLVVKTKIIRPIGFDKKAMICEKFERKV